MIVTEGLEEQLGAILNDPESMAQIFQMASSLGASSPSETSTPLMDENMLFSLMQLMQQLQQTDAKQDALLCALKPYLAPDRQAKLDKAMQIARLSRIAGFAMKNYGGLLGK